MKLISSCSSVFLAFFSEIFLFLILDFVLLAVIASGNLNILFPSWLNISLHPPLTGLVRLQLPCLYTSLDLSRLSFLTE